MNFEGIFGRKQQVDPAEVAEAAGSNNPSDLETPDNEGTRDQVKEPELSEEQDPTLKA